MGPPKAHASVLEHVSKAGVQVVKEGRSAVIVMEIIITLNMTQKPNQISSQTNVDMDREARCEWIMNDIVLLSTIMFISLSQS